MAAGFDIFHKAVKTPPYPREIFRIPLLHTFAVGSDMPAHKRLELQKFSVQLDKGRRVSYNKFS